MENDPLQIALVWKREGRDVAVATVVETWGSAPRPVGSHLVVDGEGNFEGSVSGGCVEGAVIAEALDLMAEGRARMLEFGVADETAWRVGLSCGGRIEIFVEKLGSNLASLEHLNAVRRTRKAAVQVTELGDGASRILVEGDGIDAALREAVANALRTGKSGLNEACGRRYFVNAYLPPPRIVVVGAVHISQVLGPMAALAGFDVRIIDPRTAFATPERFAGIDLAPDWPVEVLAERPLDAYTALVAVTHDPKIDDFPIAEALRTGCFYVGALGSRKTHAYRLERLKAEGVREADLARIHAPIGLSIDAASPAEIAVAILAEIIQTLRSRDVGFPQGGRP